MTRKKLNKLWQEISRMRRAPQNADALESLATRLGRKKRRGKRGKEPIWLSDAFLNLSPLSIPHHGGRDLAHGTKESILDQLEDDWLAWDIFLDD
jgi:hypothetical protein